MANPLPSSFLFGSATSAHQVEGGTHNDWSVWEKANATRLAKAASARSIYGQSRTPVWEQIKAAAKSPDNYISGAAVDHYNRYAEDLSLAQGLGLSAYRFSVEWSRIEPEPGQYDPTALAHYAAVAQACRDHGQEPFVTLWHFTLPVWAATMGGWSSPTVIKHFAAYAVMVARALQGNATHFCTMNEPEVYSALGYLTGQWPPAVRQPWRYLLVRRGLVQAHRAVYRELKTLNPKLQIGFSTNQTLFQGRAPIAAATAQVLDHVTNDYFPDRLAGHSDWIGLQYYIKRTVGRRTTSHRSDMGWALHPHGHQILLAKLARYNKPLFITESGIADASDAHRAEYIRKSLESVAAAVAAGIDCRGYFYWSLLDNFEWHEGFWPKFGLIEVDRATQSRRPRASAHFYADLIKEYREG